MGANVSATVSSVVNQSIKDIYTQITSDTLTYTTSVVKANQVMGNDFSGMEINCDLTIKQDIDVEQKILQKLSSERKNDLVNDLKNELKAAFEADITLENKKLNILQANVDVIKNNVRNLDYTKIATVIANKTQSVVNSDVNANQNMDKQSFMNAVCKAGSHLVISQNISIKNVIENVLASDEVTKEINNITNEILADVEVKKELSNTGLDPLILMIALPIAIVVAIMIILLAVGFSKGWFTSSKTSKK